MGLAVGLALSTLLGRVLGTLAERYWARNLRVFGSVARGDDRADSGVDLLVDMDPDRSLLDIVGLGQDLEELLDRRVDGLTGASLHPATL